MVIDDDRDDFDIVADAVNTIDPRIAVYYLDRCEDSGRLKDQPFDLVLLDINMPQHDGFAWLKGIRHSSYKDLPIVMYTNSANPAHIEQAYEEGANLYFTKPESYTGLIKGLKKLLSMDWTQPFSITQLYRQQGQYATFQAE